MKNVIYILPIVFLLMAGCSSTTPADGIITIDIEKAFYKNTDIFLSDFVEEIEYIPLETLRESVIGGYLRVFATDEYIVAIAFRQNYLFDRKTGKFIREIGRFGDGPNEYLATRVITPFDEDKMTILCYKNRNLELEYDLEGNIVRRIVNSVGGGDPVPLGENLFVVYKKNYLGNEPDKLVVFDEKGNVHNRFPNYHSFIPSHRSSFANSVFYKWKNNVFFFEDCVDTLFLVTKDKLIPRYHFHLGKYHPPYSQKQNLQWPHGRDYRMISKYFHFHIINESERFLFFSIRHRTSKHHPNLICLFFGFYDKASGVTKVSEVDHREITPIINDIDGFAPLYPFLWSINQSDEFVAYMEAIDIEDWFAENPEKAKKLPEHLRKFSKLTSEDNPVVMIAKLKK